MKAWKLLERGWCKGNYARDEMDHPCDVFDSKAVQFCLIGAVKRCYPSSYSSKLTIVNDHRRILGELKLKQCLAEWNDSQTSAEPVIALLKELDI